MQFGRYFAGRASKIFSEGLGIKGRSRMLVNWYQIYRNFKDDYVSTEHLLLALSKAKNDPVQLALAALGGTHEAILKALSAVRGSQRVTDQNPEGKFQALEKYAKDLTDLARRGKLDPVIGRDEEIRRVVPGLSRRAEDKSGVVGGAGGGEDAIVEGGARGGFFWGWARVCEGERG